MRCAVPLVLTILGACLPARAAVLYVNVAATGTPPTGATWDTAFTTITGALSAAGPLDEVWVAAGHYREAVAMKGSVALYGGFTGTETARDQRDPVSHPTFLNGDGVAHSLVTALGGVSGTLDGFILSATSSQTGVLCTGSSPAITNNTFADLGTGVNCGNGTAGTIANNAFRACGVGVFCSASSPAISSNLVVESSEIGIQTGSNSSPAITNNTVCNNVTGLSIYPGGPLLANNIIAYNTTGIVRGNAAPVLSHNCVYSNGTDFQGMPDPTGANGNLRQDPLFVNPDLLDFHLDAASPCIGSGDDTVPFWPVDLDGRQRPQGRHVDIGAYEFPVDTMLDVAGALRIAGGISSATADERGRLDVVHTDGSDGRVDLLDAVALARQLAGQ